MSSVSTVVFADLSGSTSLYESMGNERAAKTVMRLTQWIAEVMQAHQGRVVKMLGDGVLGIFASAHHAVAAAGELQRSHQIHLQRWPEVLRLEMHVGVASGEVLEVDGDAYGDAVNVASRLCERAGLDPEAHYGVLVRQYEAPRLKPPFNEAARRRAGFTDNELRWLQQIG